MLLKLILLFYFGGQFTNCDFIFHSIKLSCREFCDYTLIDFQNQSSRLNNKDLYENVGNFSGKITRYNTSNLDYESYKSDREQLVHFITRNPDDTIYLKNLVVYLIENNCYKRLKIFFEFPQISTGYENISEIQEILQNYKINDQFLSGIPINFEIFFNFNEMNNSWEIYGLKGNVFYTRISNQVILNSYTSLISRRSNFGRTQLTAAYIDASGSFDREYNQEIADIYGDTLNSKTNIIQLNNTVLNNNQMSTEEIILSLMEKDADFCLFPLAHSEYRLNLFDFLQTSPNYMIKIIVVFRQPPTYLHPDINLYWGLFGQSVWLIWLLTIVVLGLSYHYFLKILKENQNRFEGFQKGSSSSKVFKHVLTWGMSISCQQGWYKSPESISLKILFICGLFMSIVYYAALSASLSPKLSLQNVYIKTYKDLIASRMNIISTSGAHALQTALKNVYQERNKLAEHSTLKIERRPSLENEAFKELIQNKNNYNAFLQFPENFFESIETNNVSHSYICWNLHILNVPFILTARAASIPKKSPLKEFLNNKFLMAYERGLIFRRLKKSEKTNKAQCLDRAKVKILGFFDVFTAFVICAVGWILSLGIFILEKIKKTIK